MLVVIIGSSGYYQYTYSCGNYKEPILMGSGAFHSMPGGGAIKLVIKNNLKLDGYIDVSGSGTSVSGGAGGSIWINTKTLSGTGLMSANGGAGANGYSGGGGGRIAIYANIDANYTGNIYVHGGINTYGYSGTAGTIYKEIGENDLSRKRILIINNYNKNANGKLTIINIPANDPLHLDELHILKSAKIQFKPQRPNSNNEESIITIGNIIGDNSGAITISSRVKFIYTGYNYQGDIKILSNTINIDNNNELLVTSNFLKDNNPNNILKLDMVDITILKNAYFYCHNNNVEICNINFRNNHDGLYIINGGSYTSCNTNVNIIGSLDIMGCTNSNYKNYNSAATINDKSCSNDIYSYPTQVYCNHPFAINYFPDRYNTQLSRHIDNCIFSSDIILGCSYIESPNYNPNVNVDDGSCIFEYEDDTFQGLDYCAGNPCGSYGTCNSIINGYECQCLNGYNGIHCEHNINECNSNPCENDSICQDLVADYHCQCTNGYKGKTCNEEINECDSNPCLNGAICHDKFISYTCECLDGYEGNNCQTNINECSSNPCLNGATCYDHINSYSCSCISGYEGNNCEIDIDHCTDVSCKNGGTCIDGIGSFTCSCINGYNGEYCENNINDCASNPCLNGATCQDELASYNCLCLNGFEGNNCETNINECINNQCINNSTCIDGINEYTCSCLDGYTGNYCEIDINECDSNPCQNDGICIDDINNYSCDCTNTTFTGDTCSCYNQRDVDQYLNLDSLTDKNSIHHIATYNDYMVIGTPNDNGRILVYQYDNDINQWKYLQELFNYNNINYIDDLINDCMVDIDNNIIIIGTSQTIDNNNQYGNIIIYELNQDINLFEQVHIFTANDIDENINYFGNYVAISNNNIIVTAKYYNEIENNFIAFFNKDINNQWNLNYKYINHNLSYNNQLSYHLQLNGDRLYYTSKDEKIILLKLIL